MPGEVIVRFKNDPTKGLTVRLIKTWKKGDLGDSPIMSASSGPKDYIRNQIWAIFDADHEIDAVSLVRASGPPFLVIRKGAQYFDVTHAEVEVIKVESPPGGQKKEVPHADRR